MSATVSMPLSLARSLVRASFRTFSALSRAASTEDVVDRCLLRIAKAPTDGRRDVPRVPHQSLGLGPRHGEHRRRVRARALTEIRTSGQDDDLPLPLQHGRGGEIDMNLLSNDGVLVAARLDAERAAAVVLDDVERAAFDQGTLEKRELEPARRYAGGTDLLLSPVFNDERRRGGDYAPRDDRRDGDRDHVGEHAKHQPLAERGPLAR